MANHRVYHVGLAGVVGADENKNKHEWLPEPWKSNVVGKEFRYGLATSRAKGFQKSGMTLDGRDITPPEQIWNRQAEVYCKLREQLLDLLNSQVFVTDCLNYTVSKVTEEEAAEFSPSTRYRETDEETPLVERIRDVKIRIRDANLTYQFNRHL